MSNCLLCTVYYFYIPYYCYVDINECDTNNGGCDQNCTNEDGTFTCTCETGYTLNADGLMCDGETPLAYYFIIFIYMGRCK